MTADCGRVLIDTSVLIEYLNDARSPVGPTLKGLLDRGQACIGGPILAELLQGARSSEDMKAIEILSGSATILDTPDEAWREAGIISRKLRKKGTVVPLLDCLIAAMAVRHEARLWSHDRHFKMIAGAYPLDMFE